MPSTHAMVGLAMPVGSIVFTIARYEYHNHILELFLPPGTTIPCFPGSLWLSPGAPWSVVGEAEG